MDLPILGAMVSLKHADKGLIEREKQSAVPNFDALAEELVECEELQRLQTLILPLVVQESKLRAAAGGHEGGSNEVCHRGQ